MLHLVKNMFVAPATVCSYAKVLLKESPAQGPTVKELSTWHPVRLHHQFYQCLECVEFAVLIVMIHFW